MPKELNSKEKQVYKLLLTPIHCDKKIHNIYFEDGKVFSGQKYDSLFADEDMSDFAVGFYEIIHKNLLEGNPVLNTDNKFFNTDFAGDTMNSFQSIANVTENAGASKRNRAPYEQWPSYLQNYFTQYHCLANFWIIPMKIGRQSAKFSRYDSMDIFLKILENEYPDRMSPYRDYLHRAATFRDFCEIHFIKPGRTKEKISQMYESKDKKHGETLISYAIDDMKNRARKIAVSNHAEELWNYFYRLGLLH